MVLGKLDLPVGLIHHRFTDPAPGVVLTRAGIRRDSISAEETLRPGSAAATSEKRPLDESGLGGLGNGSGRGVLKGQAHEAGMQAMDQDHERLGTAPAEAQSRQSAPDAAEGELDGRSDPGAVQALSQMIQEPPATL